MINIDSKIKIYLYAGSTDMRKGMNGLAMLVEEKVPEKCDKEGLFVFRGKKGDRLKILWWDGQGFCLYYKVMDKGSFAWLKASEGTAGITKAQLAMLIEGVDWRHPIWSNKLVPKMSDKYSAKMVSAEESNKVKIPMIGKVMIPPCLP